MNAEVRTAISSVDRGAEGAVLLDAGGGNVAVHADVYGRKAGDYNVPSYPYAVDRTWPFNGRQPNSAAQADGGSIGGSYLFDGGFIGAAITQNNSLYRIPGIEGADHQHPHRRQADQVHRQGRISARRGGDRGDPVLGRRHRLQAQRDRPRRPRRSRPPTACGRPSPTRSRKAASKCS